MTTLSATGRLRAFSRNAPLLTALIVVSVWIVAGIFVEGFGDFGHLRYILELAAVIGIVGAGQTLVVIGGGIDLSVGAVITVTTILLPLLSPAWDPTGLVGVALALAAAFAIGLVNGIGSTYLRVHPMIMTLAMATLLQGLLVIVAGGSAVTAENPVVLWLGMARPGGISASIILWVVLAAAVLVLLHRTATGARFFAIGANSLAARLSGVNITRTTLLLYALCGLFAGIAGILVLGMNGQGYVGIGNPYLLTSIAAVVLGGTSILGGSGTYAGTVPGAILLVTITALITVVDATPGWRDIMFGGLILVLLFVSGREARR